MDYQFYKMPEERNNDNITELVIVVKNTSKKVKKAVLFGRDKFLLHPNFGSDKGIEVIGSNVSYLQILMSSQLEKLDFREVMIHGSSTQIFKKIKNIKQIFTGEQVEMYIIPSLDPMQQQGSVVKAYLLHSPSMDSFMEFEVDPNSEVQFRFYGVPLVKPKPIKPKPVLNFKKPSRWARFKASVSRLFPKRKNKNKIENILHSN